MGEKKAEEGLWPSAGQWHMENKNKSRINKLDSESSVNYLEHVWMKIEGSRTLNRGN